MNAGVYTSAASDRRRGDGYRRTPALVLLCSTMMVAADAAGQPNGPPLLRVGHAADGQRPVIDGRVDEALWMQVEPFSTFIQQEPNEGLPATERTELRFLLDRQNLYIGIICFDADPSTSWSARAGVTPTSTDTDSIRILLDTFNDGQNAFVFGTNPFGIEYDGQVMAEGQTGQIGGGGGGAGFNPNWDADWTVRTPDHRARLGGGVRHSAEDAALQPGRGAHLGRQRDAQHPPEERAGVPVAGAARLQPASRLGRRQAARA